MSFVVGLCHDVLDFGFNIPKAVVVAAGRGVFGLAYHIPTNIAVVAGSTLSAVGSTPLLGTSVAVGGIGLCYYQGASKVCQAWKECRLNTRTTQKGWQAGRRAPVQEIEIRLSVGTQHASPIKQGITGLGLLSIGALGSIGAVYELGAGLLFSKAT